MTASLTHAHLRFAALKGANLRAAADPCHPHGRGHDRGKPLAGRPVRR
jgi:hypothetical protein